MATAAAVVLMKERRLVEAFVAAGATSPQRARAVEALGVDPDGLALRRLRDRAVIREVPPGRFYLDLESWQALRRKRRRTLLLLLVVLVIVLIVGVLGTRLR
jgi:uncharacterized protein YcgI (DUF1989 family)